MAVAADELILLERVFLRIGAADTDEQLQNVVSKFLPPVLLKLSSTQDGVRKKVMELLVHINKRIKSRPTVQLPVEALLVQYQDPAASSFVTNFTIIYLKLGFPRLSIETQTQLVPTLLNSLEGKPQSHQDTLLLMVIPLLGHIVAPSDPAKRSAMFGINEKPAVAKLLLGIMLDMLLLPYGATSPDASKPATGESTFKAPPGMCEYTFKRVTTDNPLKPEDLEQQKLGIVKFISFGVFPDADILIHLVVASADTRFSVANLADLELKKITGTIDWSSPAVTKPLYTMFLGTLGEDTNVKPEHRKTPANARIRLKLFYNLNRVTGDGFHLLPSIQVIFSSLCGDSHPRLKTLALKYATHLVLQVDVSNSLLFGGLLTMMSNSNSKADLLQQQQFFVLLGHMARISPYFFNYDLSTLTDILNQLIEAPMELRLSIREALLNMLNCYKVESPEYTNKVIDLKNLEKTFQEKPETRTFELKLIELISQYIHSDEPIARYIAVRYAASSFPENHVSARFLLLLATGDTKDDIFMEALKALYGTTSKFDSNQDDDTRKTVVAYPNFNSMTAFIANEAKLRKQDERRYEQTNHVLPFSPTVYTEMLAYLRLCLAQDAKLTLARGVAQHPNEKTPLLSAYLRAFFDGNKTVDKTHPLKQYLVLIQEFMTAFPGIIPISCLLEVVGCIPDLLYSDYMGNLSWFKGFLGSTKEEIREHASVLYGILTAHGLNDKDYDAMINELVKVVKTSKNLENQHGSLLAIANSLERRITIRKNKSQLQGVGMDWTAYKNAVELLITTLDNSNPLLVSAACAGLGLLGRCYILPLNNKSDNEKDLTKLSLVKKILTIMNSTKYQSKLRERAARTVGLICVGEIFPHTKEVIKGLLNTAKETKDVEVHFSVGESLVMCVQSIWSNEARDPWTVLPSDYSPTDSMMETPSDDDLDWLLEQLLQMVNVPHPNSRQATCIWLLALLKHCSGREAVSKRFPVLQNAFKDLLAENSEIVQDVASKGLGLVYEYCDEDLRKDMLESLLDQLQSGRRNVAKVTDDTKLFEEGQLGKSPTGGNLTTYKEICSLASDLNKPDLIFKFMHLANHNAIWNSKKGAAFGFSTIASKAGEQIAPHLPKIIPRLYRYQYDPTPNLQNSMHRIWNELVPDKQKALDKYYKEILLDLINNLTSAQWRVRLSCCLALQDFLRGSSNRSIHDCTDKIDELWTQLFRVMDDYHEGTRNAATATSKVLSKICVAGCDVNQGKNGTELMNKMLPVLLETGITHTVSEVRNISLLTVSKLIKSAGDSLKPFLPTLIPALLQATGELESANLSHLSTIYSGRVEVQEAIDSARASAVKSHYTMDTLAKCLQYVDVSAMDALVPKIADIMKNSVGLGTKVGSAHFIILLTVQLGKELTPYTGKFLSILLNGLMDRNVAVRKQYAVAIGHLVGTAKDSSLEKLFAKLQSWYFKHEDQTVRSVIAQTIRAIAVQNQEVLKNFSDVVLPLVFFAMHAEKTEDTKDTIELWKEIWNENSPGTETGIRQNLQQISDLVQNSLESSNWNDKAQAANAISTVAEKLGSSIDEKQRNQLIKMLVNGMSGRTWSGKEKLIKALASLCKNCKKIKEDPDVNIDQLINAVMKECNKEEIVYKRHCLEACGDILEALEIDKFDDLYNIVQDSLTKNTNNISKDDDSDGETTGEAIAKKRENLLKLQETIYETLGKAWPSNTVTQEKYRMLFVEHCAKCLPTTVRNVQVSIVLALQKYVEKLTLFQDSISTLSKSDRDILNTILNHIIEAMKITLDISKHLRLRKESLNVLITLCKRLKAIDANSEIELVGKMLRSGCFTDVEKDAQPEVKTRVLELKELTRL